MKYKILQEDLDAISKWVEGEGLILGRPKTIKTKVRELLENYYDARERPVSHQYLRTRAETPPLATQVKDNLMEENLVWIKKWLSTDRGLQPGIHKALEQLVTTIENQEGIIKGLRKTNKSFLQTQGNLEAECQRLDAQVEMVVNNEGRLMDELEKTQAINNGLRKTNETLLQTQGNLEYGLTRAEKDFSYEVEAHVETQEKLADTQKKLDRVENLRADRYESDRDIYERIRYKPMDASPDKPVEIPRIEVGDRVTIHYVAHTLECILVHRPQGEGDVWEFQNIETQDVFVQNPYSRFLDGWVKKKDK